MKQGTTHMTRAGTSFLVNATIKDDGTQHIHIQHVHDVCGISFNVLYKNKIKDIYIMYPRYTADEHNLKMLKDCMSLAQSIVEKLKEA